MKLIFNVENQHMTIPVKKNIVADSVEYLEAMFVFTHDWDECKKTAVFKQGEDAYTVLLKNDSCIVPYEVIKEYFEVSVFGVNDTTRITTNEVFVTVQKSGYAEGETPKEPTPDVYAQILGELDDKVDKYDFETEMNAWARTLEATKADLERGVADKLPFGVLNDVDLSTFSKAGIYQLGDGVTGVPENYNPVCGATLIVSPVKEYLDDGQKYFNQYLFVNDAGTELYSCQIYIGGDDEFSYDMPWTKAYSTEIINIERNGGVCYLYHNRETRYDIAESLSLKLPEERPDDYISSVIFTSGEIVPSFTAEGIIMCGDECEDGVFTPEANKRYTIIVSYDGVNVIGDVRGVSL